MKEKKMNEKTTSQAIIRMKLAQLKDCDRITAKEAYNQTSRWYASNHGATLEEVITRYQETKQKILQTDFYSINGLKNALTDKSANL